jgi:cyclophilin family peptidyl-prolyl cis-trans isomerase
MNYANLSSRNKHWKTSLYALIVFTFLMSALAFANTETQTNSNPVAKNPRVTLNTSLGNIEIEIFADKAPVTAANFLYYVDNNFYSNTLFHRVIPGFMIQGGGFTKGMVEKATQLPIKNEAGNGLHNLRGTIAMARTQVISSATAQFFINVADNASLDHRNNTADGYGYCVFGQVTKGMDVVDKIVHVATTAVGPYEDVPQTDVTILTAKRVK